MGVICKRIVKKGKIRMPYKQKRYCRVCNKTATHGAYCEEHAPQRDYRAEDNRRTKNIWDRWYKTAIWKEKRERQLKREPLCRECLSKEIYTKATDVDHIIPHKGNWNLFIGEDNLESLCHACHSRKTARENKLNGIWK